MGAASPKKTATPRTSRKKATAPVGLKDLPTEPIVLGGESDEQEVEMVDLFTVNGVTYSIPKRPPVNIALGFLRDVRKEGPTLAEAALMERLIGEEGYDALVNYPGLTTEQMEQISDRVMTVTLGAMEASKGK
ncbi:hypothetical protein ACFQH9_02145 [Pseudonocardia lutea]|uniref:Tail assembly chaperone n=1 Tax=Pseudonocardia lutea TaxID=2172015 RepID=A0ABW1I0D3_9PSEU